MLAVAIIVFREALEAGLIISITDASVGIHGRNTWISGGIVGDVAGVGLIALFAASIAQAFAVSGQDVLNASILLVAFIMLGWHVAWIARLVALSTPLSGRVTRALAWGGMIVGGSLFAPNVAKAEIHVRSPLVEFREFEFEMNGLASTKSTAGQFNGGQSYTYALGYAPLPWYKFEVELETSAQLIEPGADGTDPLQLEAQTFENFFQFTPDGKYFVNAGFFVEYSQGLLKNSPNNISFGPLLSKEIGVFRLDTLHTLNVFLEREVGPHASSDTGLFYAWQSLGLLHPLFNPGVELYGEIASLQHAGSYKDQGHSIGPVITGAVRIPFGKIKYEVGYQWGLSNATARGAARWRFEYEIPF